MHHRKDREAETIVTRRTFIRFLLGILVILGAAGTGLYKLLKAQEEDLVLQQPESPVSPQPADPGTDTGEPLFSMMIFSDLHISENDPNTIKHLKQGMDDLQRLGSPVDALVITGDLTEYGREKDYRELKEILSAYPLPPVLANMGNHDYYDIWIDKFGAFNKESMPNGKTDQGSRERFQTFFGLQKPYHDAWINNHHVILLSQETYVQEKPEVGEGAWYSEEQLNWLREKLEAHKDGRPVFVMTHQPLPPAGEDGGSHRLIPAKKFREILRPYKNVFVFAGHRHQDFQGTTEHYVKEGFHYFHNSSVGRVLNRNFQNAAKEKAQGLYVQVYRNRVTLRGRDLVGGAWLKEADWTVKLT
ncbi:phosphohydrolase [Paenibacillus mucilaginosus]|nr:phosphohydrolase [Paenibacillus mucilaginosus]